MNKNNLDIFLEKENLKLKQLLLDNKGQEYSSQLESLFRVCELAHMDDLDLTLKDHKIEEWFDATLRVVSRKMKPVASYDVDLASQKVLINYEDGKRAESDIISLPEVLKSMKIDESNNYYFLIMSFLMDSSRFDIIQLYFALNKK